MRQSPKTTRIVWWERTPPAEAHAAATDASSSRPPAPTDDEAFAALADGVDDVDREIAEDERAIERLLSGDDEQNEFAALADGLGDGGE